ncbi:OmpA family protein [Tundrisphaera sp. TA3]|uniref:OmpA family protein n=1 Tax=Tundrisphaera sp. TA3 TaxID=3435775 RepID=UPI003EBEA20A
MRREITKGRALANAGFVVVALAMAGYGLRQMAGRAWAWQPTFRVSAGFATIGGLEVGAKVRVQGIDAGVVEAIVPPPTPGAEVGLVFRVDDRLRSLVRSDARVRIVPQGVIGAKVVEIVPGRPDAPALADGSRLAAEPAIEIADILRDARSAIGRVDAAAQAAEKGLGEVGAIAATIREGKGSLGKLVQDDEAYRKLIALSEHGTKTIDDLDENLAALKGTWPLSRYFDGRGFADRDKILFKPGAERESRILGADDLFERGRSVLTAGGRSRLDGVAAWFQKAKRPKSELVIAAFTDDRADPDLAQILTQEQAEAVKNYLVSKHGIDVNGWFGTRKIAAVGFGAEPPRSALAQGGGPPRRVEVILFTPQA